ncbi:MAG: hypothetical protein H6Q67_1334 [Firmicutes bacterium]|nr:hypothetical protein [Bacillota bacterium]
MNNRQKGYYRDRLIQEVLAEWGVLDIYQLAQMFFPSMKMAQKRMQRLAELKKVKKSRDSIGEPYIYYAEKKPGQIEHRLGVNWVRVWLLANLRSWEKAYSFHYEVNYGALRPDGLMGIYNTVTNKHRFVFIEYDRGFNKFDKVEKYEKWFNIDGYVGQWWTKYTERFPPILVVSEKPPKVNSKLEFQIKAMEEIKKCPTQNLFGSLSSRERLLSCASE